MGGLLGRSLILHQLLAPGVPLGKSEASQASGLLGPCPPAPRVAGAQETQGTPGERAWQPFPGNFSWAEDTACCFSGLRPPGVQGLGEGALGDGGLATPKRPMCPSGSLPKRAPDPRASLSSPFPQGPVPPRTGPGCWAEATKDPGDRETPGEGPEDRCSQGPVARPPNSVTGAELPERLESRARGRRGLGGE